MKYGDKCWGKKKKGGEEGWERKKRKRVEEEKYENKPYIFIYIYIYITSKEMVAGAKGKGIFNEGEGVGPKLEYVEKGIKMGEKKKGGGEGG